MNSNSFPKLCNSGQICPISGIWESLGNFKTTCLVSEGSRMPYYCNTKTIWMLVQTG